MGSQYLARLGVLLAIDTAKWEASVNEAIAANQKLKKEITQNSRAAEKEIERLIWAVKDYGREVTLAEKMEREFLKGGKYAAATAERQAELRRLAREYDAVAASARKSATDQLKAAGGLNKQQIAALGYQTTDILTGLASGQNPLLVLIQQGGQLRDQFGGFVPLFNGIKSVLTATRVIVGGLGGAIAALAYAAYKGNEDFKEFRNNLALTNNVMGLTYDSANRLTDSLAKGVNISISDAKDILLELVKSGKVSGDALEPAAKAIGNIAKLSGQSASEVAKNLIPSLNGTASSAKNLNDQYNFLTAAQYRQIEALDLAGQKQKAIKLTLDLLNQSIDSQKDKLEITDGWWKKLTITVSNFWESLKKLGAPETDDEALLRLSRRIEFLSKEASGKLFEDKGLKNAIEQAQKDYLSKWEQIVKKRNEIESKGAQQRKENESISIWESVGGEKKRQEILFDTRKTYADMEFQQRVAGLNEFGRIELEAEKKHQEAIVELVKKNQETKAQFTKELIDNYLAKAAAIEFERQQKILEVSRLAAEEVRKEQQGRLDGLNTEKEKLQIYEQNILISEADYKIALNKLRAEQEIAKIRANQKLTPEDQEIAINRERNIQKTADEIAKLEERLGFLRDVNNAVFKNMENSVEQFVRTGKFAFKDFAASVIRDILAIYMKAQLLQMFNMGKSWLGMAFSGFAATATPGGGMEMAYPNTAADGGYINQPTLVGENGPELFIPRTAGTIVPNQQISNYQGQPQIVYNGPYIAQMSAIDTQSATQFLAKNKQAVWSANQSASRSIPQSR